MANDQARMTDNEKEAVVMMYRARLGVAVCVMWLLCFTHGAGVDAADAPVMIDPNTKCVDLSDLTGDLPLEVSRTTQILWQSEAWERSTWSGDDGRESGGYPTVVRNDRGRNSDNRYYLFYAHHDPNSGIGCAVAESIEGPYVKLAQGDPARGDSRVLVCPGKPGQPFHYSSPCVAWNERSKPGSCTFTTTRTSGRTGGGHQHLPGDGADLAASVWTPWTDEKGKLVPVLPVTAERWMNSQSSYHAMQRLPDGRWLGFLRGTGASSAKAGNGSRILANWDSPSRPMAVAGITARQIR